jgi:hypothetical protein
LGAGEDSERRETEWERLSKISLELLAVEIELQRPINVLTA